MASDSVKVTLTGDAASLLRMFQETSAAADRSATSTSSAFAAAGADMAAEFSAATDKMKEAAASLAAESDVDADAMKAKLISAMLEVEAVAERVRAENAKPMFGPTAADAERVRKSMEDDAAAAADLNAKFDAAKAAAEDEGDAVDDLSGKLDKNTKSSHDAGGGLGTLIKMAEAAAPALVTVGVAGIGALGGVAVLAGTAALGIGAFALAASGDMADVKSKAAQMLATFQEANAPAVLPVLSGALALLPHVFSMLTPLVTTTGSALKGLEGDVAGAIGSPYWAHFDQLLAGQAGSAVTTFGNLILGAGKALAGLDTAFAPLITDIEHGLDGWATSMSNFGATASGNTGLGAFVSYVEKEGPAVLHTLGLLGSDFGMLAKDASAVGPGFLTIIDAAARLLGGVERLSPGLVEVGIALFSMYKAASVLSPALGLLKDASNFSKLLSGQNAADSAASGFGRMTSAAGRLRTSIYEAGAGAVNAQAGITGVGSAASTAGTELEDAGTQAGTAGTEFATTGTEAETAGAQVAAAGTEAETGATGFTTAGTEAEAAGAKAELGAEGFVALGEGAEVAGADAEVAGAAIGIGLDEALGPIGLAAIAITGLIAIFHHSSAAASAAGTSFASDFASQLQSAGDTGQQIIAGLSGEIATYTSKLDALRSATTTTTAATAAGNGRFAQGSATVSDATSAESKEMSALEGKIAGLKTQLADATTHQSALADATRLAAAQTAAGAAAAGQAVSPAQAFAAGIKGVNSALETESTDATNASNAINVLTGNYLSAQGATLNEKQAVDSFATSLKAAHGNLNGNSQASLAAQQSANSFASDLYGQLIPALAKNGDSAKKITSITGGLVAQLDAAARHAGLTGGQVDALNAKYALTPKQVTTAINLEGASEVESQAATAKADLEQAAKTYTAQFLAHLVISETTHAIPGHAAGGIVTSPELAWIAEAGYPEAVVPLRDGLSKAAIANSVQKFLGTNLDATGVGSGTGGGVPAGVGSSQSGLGLSSLAGVTLQTKLRENPVEEAAHQAAIKAEEASQKKALADMAKSVKAETANAAKTVVESRKVEADAAATIGKRNARAALDEAEDTARAARDARREKGELAAVDRRTKRDEKAARPVHYQNESAKAWAKAQAQARTEDKSIAKSAAEEKAAIRSRTEDAAAAAAKEAARTEAADERTRAAADKEVAHLAKERQGYDRLSKQLQSMISALERVNVGRDSSDTNIHVVAQTGADSNQIAKDIAWALKTGG